MEKDIVADLHEKPKNYLGEEEIKQLLLASKKSRNPERNYALLLMMYRHGLRVSEAINIRIDDVNFGQARVWINRLKNGLSVEHPINGDELRAIKRYLNKRKDLLPWLFISEHKQPLSRHTVRQIIVTASKKASLPHVYPHMLRHSCGYYLANRGHDLRLIQDYLGHRDPKHTARYTRTASRRFQNLWGA